MTQLPSTRLEWLRHYCRAKNITNARGEPGSAELAARIGRSQNYCSQLLLGKKSFGEDIARHIEAELGLLRWDLDGGAGWPFPDIDRRRYDALSSTQRAEIQGAVRTLLIEFEGAEANRKSA